MMVLPISLLDHLLKGSTQYEFTATQSEFVGFSVKIVEWI